jgi:Flp pilus assembly pilin Flp
LKDKSGQGLVEYAFIFGLTAMICLLGLKHFGANVSNTITQVSANMSYESSAPKLAGKAYEVQVVDSIVYRRPLGFAWNIPSLHLKESYRKEAASAFDSVSALMAKLTKLPAAVVLEPASRAGSPATSAKRPSDS